MMEDATLEPSNVECLLALQGFRVFDQLRRAGLLF